MVDPSRIGFSNLYPNLTPSAPIYNNSTALSYSNNEIASRHNHGRNNNGFYWTNWSAGQRSPISGVRGGTDIDGTAIYVGRAHYNGELIPAKVMPDKNVAYIPWGGEEITIHNCELLCQQQFSWMSSSGGHVPHGAVPVGNTSDGETLYAGRVFHEGSHCVGKVHPSHGVCYVPFGGREHSHSNYEILVLTDQGYCC